MRSTMGLLVFLFTPQLKLQAKKREQLSYPSLNRGFFCRLRFTTYGISFRPKNISVKKIYEVMPFQENLSEICFLIEIIFRGGTDKFLAPDIFQS